MKSILELTEKRNKLWNAAKEFLESSRNEKGILSEEDTKTYEKMEKEVMDLGREITRLQRQSAIDEELSKDTSKPITSKPGAKPSDDGEGRASGEYKKEFWNAMRKKNYYDVTNTLTIGENSEGGYLVPDEFERKLVEGLEEEEFFRTLASVINTTSGDRKIPVVSSKGEAAWIEEGEDYPEDDDTFRQVTIGAFKVATNIKVSEELLNDSAFDIEAYISKEFARRIAAKEEEAFFVGDGQGKPTGIFDATAGGEVGTTTSTQSVTFDDVIDLFHSLKSPYRNKAVWIVNDSTVKVLRKLKDKNDNYLWQPSVKDGQPDRILNRPVYTSVYAPEIGAGNCPIAFGDFSYYWIADRQGRSFKRLNEIYATKGQIGFIGSQRVDGKLILPEAVKLLKIKESNSNNNNSNG